VTTERMKKWLSENKVIWMLPLFWLVVLAGLMLYQAVASDDEPFTYILF